MSNPYPFFKLFHLICKNMKSKAYISDYWVCPLVSSSFMSTEAIQSIFAIILRRKIFLRNRYFNTFYFYLSKKEKKYNSEEMYRSVFSSTFHIKQTKNFVDKKTSLSSPPPKVFANKAFFIVKKSKKFCHHEDFVQKSIFFFCKMLT